MDCAPYLHEESLSLLRREKRRGVGGGRGGTRRPCEMCVLRRGARSIEAAAGARRQQGCCDRRSPLRPPGPLADRGRRVAPRRWRAAPGAGDRSMEVRDGNGARRPSPVAAWLRGELRWNMAGARQRLLPPSGNSCVVLPYWFLTCDVRPGFLGDMVWLSNRYLVISCLVRIWSNLGCS